MFRFCVCVTALIGLAWCVSPLRAGVPLLPTELRELANVDSSSDCGAKSLFLYCRALGLDLDEKSITSLCHVRSDGMSLADLSAAAAGVGITLDGVFADSVELARLPKPLIALMEPDSIEGGVGHFVVLLNVADGHVKVADPRYDSIIDVPLVMFARASSGCYLIPSRRFERLAWGLVGGVCLLASVLLISWKRFKSPRRLCVSVALLALLVGCDGASRNEKKYVPIEILKVDRESHDLGTIGGTPKQTVEFRLTNTGTVPLTFEVTKSCGCVDTKFTPPPPLSPSQETILSLEVDATGKYPGYFSEFVFVRPLEIPEEKRLYVSGRVEGVWIDGAELTLHTSDQKLPQLEVRGYFVTKKPAVEFPSVTLGTTELVAEVARRQVDVTPDPFGGYRLKWLIPLAEPSKKWRSKHGSQYGKVRAVVAGREQELSVQLHILP